MDISDQHSDNSDFKDIGFNDKSDFDDLGAPHNGGSGQQPDNKVQSPKENTGMDPISENNTYSFEGFAQAHPAKAEELIAKLTEVTGFTDRKILYNAFDESRKSYPNAMCYNVKIAIEWLLQLQLSESEQTSARTSHVKKCDRTRKWIATQPLKQSAANYDSLPCGPVNENEPNMIVSTTPQTTTHVDTTAASSPPPGVNNNAGLQGQQLQQQPQQAQGPRQAGQQGAGGPPGLADTSSAKHNQVNIVKNPLILKN
jgi:hypothetical protein